MKRNLILVYLYFFICISSFAANTQQAADPLTPTFDFKYSWSLDDLVYTGFTNADYASIGPFLNSLESNKYSKDWNNVSGAPSVIGNQDMARFALSGSDPYNVSLAGSNNKPVYLWVALRTLNNVDIKIQGTPLVYSGSGEPQYIDYDLQVTTKDITGAPSAIDAIPLINVTNAASTPVIIAQKTSGIFWKYIGEIDLTANVKAAWPQTYTGQLTVIIEDRGV